MMHFIGKTIKKVNKIFNKISSTFVIISIFAILLSGCGAVDITLNNNLIISTLNEETKGNIVSFNLDSNTKKILIKDRDVGITGDQSKDGSKVAYADALGDTDPWKIYLKDVNNDQISKITTNNLLPNFCIQL